jgi:putative redox protein
MAKNPIDATLTWRRDLIFDATAGAQAVRIDSDNADGISPMNALAVALAGCMAVDVVMILTKGRHALGALEVRVHGLRADGPPSYFTDISLHYAIVGPVPDEAVQRAIDLSRDKYCSVFHTLRPDLRLTITHAIAAA